MGLVFGTAMLFASLQIHRAVSESIDLRFELADSHANGQRLARIANSDALTGIANRRAFDEVLEKEWRRALRHGSSVSMILADIDHFKAYNDRYGHAAGDECLRRVAQAVARVVHRPADLVARVGGEEFGVLLPETPLAGASKIAEDIRLAVIALEIEHATSASDCRVTMSLGVATLVPQEVLRPVTLFERADQALYRAKHQGRNRVGLHWGSTPVKSTPEPIPAPPDAGGRAADTPPGRRTG
jgi:diguanylate cyclase (GGDEF)-like protein